MHLEGSCHCGAVKFSLESDTPYPFMHCHCSICRKTAGGGGYAINLGGDARTRRYAGRGIWASITLSCASRASARADRPPSGIFA
ncbi:MAG: alanine acetyltransferase [Rhodocyclales bacterium]|nr:alanine acetyltransferase [Rhodocyclales bacterium]